MKITVFAKRIKTKDGKSFIEFVTSLERKDGTKQYMRAMYSGKDKNKAFDADMCPMIIEFDKANANVSTKTFVSKTGEERKNYTLWIKDYTKTNEVYVDHTLDDFI